jgi:hypothetical protein
MSKNRIFFTLYFPSQCFFFERIYFLKILTVLQIILVLSKLPRYYYYIYQLVGRMHETWQPWVITTGEKHMRASTPTTVTWHVPCTPMRLREAGHDISHGTSGNKENERISKDCFTNAF